MRCRSSYQTQGEVEQSRAAVEQHGDQRGGGGEEQPHVPAHDHPQRLQDLGEDVPSLLPRSPEGARPSQRSPRSGEGVHDLVGQESRVGRGPRGPDASNLGCSLQPHREQSLNVLLQEGGHVLPVHDVIQPAVLPLQILLAAWASGVGHVLEGARKARIQVCWRVGGGGVLALP